MGSSGLHSQAVEFHFGLTAMAAASAGVGVLISFPSSPETVAAGTVSSPLTVREQPNRGAALTLVESA